MSVREVDESETGSANFFGPIRPCPREIGLGRTSGPRSGSPVEFGAVHLRPPAFSHGFTSFLWAVGLGLFVWIGLLGIGVGAGTAFLFGFLAAVGIFFYVLLYGGPEYRR